MEKLVNKKKVLSVIFVLSAIFLINYVFAEVMLVCLNKGETIEFSKCNPNINDYLCRFTKCQICVNEINPGIYCQQSPSICNDAGISECIYLSEQSEENVTPVELPVITAPKITLISPNESFYLSEPGKIDFVFKTTNATKIEKCNLLIDGKVEGFKTSLSLSSQKLSSEVTTGVHTWTVECHAKENLGYTWDATNPELITFSVGEEIYDIVSLSPPRDASFSGAQEIIFEYNISDLILKENLDACTLFVNDIAQANTTEINYTNQIKYTLDIGTYNWSVVCNANNDLFVSELRILTINAPAPAPSSGGGSGGGGSSSSRRSSGGGGALVPANITKTNVVNATNESSNATSNITSIQQIEDEEELDYKEDTKGFSSITGAVSAVRQGINENKIPVIIVVITIVIIGIIFYSNKNTPEE